MRNRERLAEELDRLKKRRDTLSKKIEELEKIYVETENAEILGLVRSYSLTPEELAKLMAHLGKKTPGRLEDMIDKKED